MEEEEEEERAAPLEGVVSDPGTSSSMKSILFQ